MLFEIPPFMRIHIWDPLEDYLWGKSWLAASLFGSTSISDGKDSKTMTYLNYNFQNKLDQ